MFDVGTVTESPFLSQLLEICRRQPERPALEQGEQVLTYGKLAELVSQTHHQAGFCLVQGPRGIEFVLELLRCWKSDRAVPLPLDPAFPAERRAELTSLLEGAPVEGVAYAITTSGSSGRPKVVLMGEGGLLPVLCAQIEHFELGPESRCLWMLSPGFDASLSDIGVALLSGGCLVCAPCDAARRLPALLREKRITYLDMPPGLLEIYRPEEFPEHLQTLVVGGAPSRPELLREWARVFRLFVVYGPTEATICSSLSRVDEEWDQPYLGQPIAGNRYRVVEGELQIAGPGLALGYLDGESTARAFTQDEGIRWYRTGDLVGTTQSHHGLKFLGRADRQIKLRGQRIELEELERRLWDDFGADRVAVVLAREHLAVFWEGDGDEMKARTRLARDLPPAWQPGSWTRLPSLPRTLNGKVSRTALAERVVPVEQLDSLAAVERCLVLEQQGFSVSVPELLGRRTAVQSTLELQQRADLLLASRRPSAEAKGKAMLVTGSTGRLGRALIPLLDRPLILLQRQPQQGEHDVMKGDVSLPNLGMSSERFAGLAGKVGTVLHLAGCLDLSRSLDELIKVNASSLLRLSELGAPVHYASTLACQLAFEPRPHFVRPDSPIGKGLVFGGYAQSKWVAERLFEALPSTGWKFRYGQLLGEPQRDELLYQTVRGLRDLGSVPKLESGRDFSFDFTPLDWAARVTATWLATPGEGTLHVTCGVKVPVSLLFQLLELPTVTAERFFELTPPTPAASVAQRCLGVLAPGGGVGWRDFDLLLTSGVQDLSPIERPAPWSARRVEQELATYVKRTLQAEGGG